MSQIDVQNDHSIMDSSETDEWSKETIKKMSTTHKMIKYSRKLLKYTLVGTGSLAGLVALFLAISYICLNSKLYERSTYTKEDWERLMWRLKSVKHGMEDPCKYNRFEIDYDKWKCDEEDLSDLNIEDIPI
jgi:hypothetical protein